MTKYIVCSRVVNLFLLLPGFEAGFGIQYYPMYKKYLDTLYVLIYILAQNTVYFQKAQPVAYLLSGNFAYLYYRYYVYFTVLPGVR